MNPLAVIAVIACVGAGAAVGVYVMMSDGGTVLEDNEIVVTGDTTVTYTGEAVSVPEYTVSGGATCTVTWLSGSTEISAPTDAGSYTLRITAAAAGNYLETVKDFDFVIGKADNVITVTGSTASSYTGSAVSVPEYTVLGGATCTVVWYDSDGVETAAPADDGTYTFVITAAATDNYKETSASFTYTLTDDRASNTITITGATSKDYDGEAAETPAYTVLDGAECTVRWLSGTTVIDAPTDAGTYTLKIIAASTDNYKKTEASTTYAINKISNTISVTGLTSVSYSGAAVSDPYYTYLGNGTCTTSWYSGSTEISAPTDAGTYTFRVSVAEGTNHLAASLDTEYSITQIPNTIAVTGDCTKDYDGEAAAVPAYTVLGSASCTVTWYASDGVNEISAPTEVGEYKFGIVAAETTNFEETSAVFDFEIALASSTVTIQSDLSVEYTGSAVSDPSFSVSGGTSWTTGWYASDGTTSIFAPSEVGDYVFRITVAASGNYAETVYDALFEIYEQADLGFTTYLCVDDVYTETTEGYTWAEDGYGGYTVTFGSISGDTVYKITGSLTGNIVIDPVNDYEFKLEMEDFSLTSAYNTPVAALSGDKITITAEKGSTNTIADNRSAVDDTDETQYGYAVYSAVDLDLKGKGSLSIVSANNNGIHTKDDLDVKNLTLYVESEDNALKGNDSVDITSGTLTLIARTGDGIKTSNTELKEKDDSTYKQQGIITVNTDDGNLTMNIYAACDGIDASYDVVISGSPVINIYTDTYSPYSEEVTETDTDMYMKTQISSSYSFSIYYYSSSDSSVNKWVNLSSPTYSGYYYVYTFEAPSSSTYDKFVVYSYSGSQTQGQSSSYTQKSSVKTVNTNYDCIIVSSKNSSLSVSWSTYSSSSSGSGWGGPGGMGGMQEGNSDKGTYSTKGIKADNSITISGGTIYAKAYDDAIHANSDTLIDYGSTTGYGTGNVTISGASVTVYSNDDGIHADGALTISSGTVTVESSYEGLEGATVTVSGGQVYTRSSDDGINASGTITLSGGYVFVYAGGDGIDSNCTTSYKSILFSGAVVAVVSTSSGNSAIDTDSGYTYSSGEVLAICPQGMTSECTAGYNFSSYGKTGSISMSSGNYLTVKVSSSAVMAIKMPCSLSSAFVMYLGSSSAAFSSATSYSGLTEVMEGYIYT